MLQKLNGMSKSVPRWHMCSELTNQLFGPVISNVYIDKYYRGNAKADVSMLVYLSFT